MSDDRITTLMEQWIRNAIHDPQVSEKPIDKIVLLHIGGTRPQTLYTESEIGKGSDTEGLASAFLSRAQDDCDSLGGLQTYCLQSFHTGKKPSSVYRFRLHAENNPFEVESEPPTEKGITRQLMRLNEAQSKIALTKDQHLFRHYERIIDRQDRRIEFLESKLTEVQGAYDEIIGMQHEREMERIEIEGKEKRRDDIVESAKRFAPILVNKVAGRPALPAEDPFRMMVENFLLSLDHSQLQKMMQAAELNPEQQTQMLALMDTVLPPKKTAG